MANACVTGNFRKLPATRLSGCRLSGQPHGLAAGMHISLQKRAISLISQMRNCRGSLTWTRHNLPSADRLQPSQSSAIAFAFLQRPAALANSLFDFTSTGETCNSIQSQCFKQIDLCAYAGLVAFWDYYCSLTILNCACTPGLLYFDFTAISRCTQQGLASCATVKALSWMVLASFSDSDQLTCATGRRICVL